MKNLHWLEKLPVSYQVESKGDLSVSGRCEGFCQRRDDSQVKINTASYTRSGQQGNFIDEGTDDDENDENSGERLLLGYKISEESHDYSVALKTQRQKWL